MPGDCQGSLIITRTFTATDDAGNSTSATQTITVQDTTAPELTIPADYTAECTEELTFDDATATDNCSCDPRLTSERWQVNAPMPTSSFAFTARMLAATVRLRRKPFLWWTRRGQTCSSHRATKRIAVTSWCCWMPWRATRVVWPCDGRRNYDYTCDNSYVLTRTFTAVDACFNETVGVQTITVTDTTAPEFTSIPADFSAECSDEIAGHGDCHRRLR